MHTFHRSIFCKKKHFFFFENQDARAENKQKFEENNEKEPRNVAQILGFVIHNHIILDEKLRCEKRENVHDFKLNP